jgi:hypothetical protein
MNFIDKNLTKIILAFLVLVSIGQCGNCRRSASIEKKIKDTNTRIDSICTRKEIKKIVEIEGLKSEKRMIQSTDRKILDVNRQSEIDAQLKNLNENE